MLLLRSHRFWRFCWIFLAYFLPSISTADGCRGDQFACSDGNECIRLSYRCDGTPECDDGSDELACEKPILDNYLLVSVARHDTEAQHIRPQIYQVDLATGHARPFLRTEPLAPASLAIDHQRQVLYYVDRSAEMICRVSLTEGNASIIVIYRDPTLNADIEGLAVDATKQKLYFCDGGHNRKIAEIDLLDQYRTQRIVISNKNLKPKAIVIDETNSELYYSDWGSKPGIFTIGLEPNSQLQTLVADDIVIPNALAIDFKEEVMYWVDALLDRIEMANLDGHHRRVLVKESGDVHYYAMTISSQFLYLTDWTKSAVLRVDRLTNITSDQVPVIAGIKTGIAYYNSNFTNVGRARIQRRTVVPYSTTISTSDGKANAEKLVDENGAPIVIALSVTGSLLFLLIIALAIWFGLRRRRRNAEVAVAYGYSPENAYDDVNSFRGRLLIEDAYVTKANSYEHLPEFGTAPAVPAKRPDPTACEPDDAWYSKLANVSGDPVKNEEFYVKPTEYDYYDDVV